jgi:hypothetical protein
MVIAHIHFMLSHFSRNIAFTKLVKSEDRLREYNFRKLPGMQTDLFHVDVSDDRGNRIQFRMEKVDGQWKIVDQVLPAWIKTAEPKLHEKIEEGYHDYQEM